ncbi:MAG: ABC transporter ATP-binding protein [Bacillaceae bacterium]
MIEVKNINKEINGQYILKDVSFSLQEGQIVGLLGRNGAGKTTLFRTMVGILLPDNGDVTINGQSAYTNPSSKQQMIYVPDYPAFLMHYTVEELISLYKDIYPNFDETFFREKLKQYHLPNRHIRHYSKGMQALFAILLAFSTKAGFYLLDEPTNGLDPIIKKQVIQLMVEHVAETNCTLLISSHQLEELEKVCDTMMFMKNNTIDYITSLEDARHQYRKIQVAYQEGLPDILKSLPNVHLLSELGRVSILMIDDNIDETVQVLKNHYPLLLEELPLTLEEVFIKHLGGDYDV